MNPDTTTLLDDLTGPRGEHPAALLAAARTRRRRRVQTRAFAVSALAVIAVTAAVRFMPAPSPAPVIVSTPPAPTVMLTKSELLDSFGDQPVALVTWPDGRQTLLAIAHRPGR